MKDKIIIIHIKKKKKRNQSDPIGPSMYVYPIFFFFFFFSSFFGFLSQPKPSSHLLSPSNRRSSTRASPWESPAAGDATLRAQPEMISGKVIRSRRNSRPNHSFSHFLAPSDVFSRKWDQIWNILSTIYKTIPLLLANSAMLESSSLFTLWLLRFFWRNQAIS